MLRSFLWFLLLVTQVPMMLAQMDESCDNPVPYSRLFTVAVVGFVAGGALTIQSPIAYAALYVL